MQAPVPSRQSVFSGLGIEHVFAVDVSVLFSEADDILSSSGRFFRCPAATTHHRGRSHDPRLRSAHWRVENSDMAAQPCVSPVICGHHSHPYQRFACHREGDPPPPPTLNPDGQVKRFHNERPLRSLNAQQNFQPRCDSCPPKVVHRVWLRHPSRRPPTNVLRLTSKKSAKRSRWRVRIWWRAAPSGVRRRDTSPSRLQLEST